MLSWLYRGRTSLNLVGMRHFARASKGPSFETHMNVALVGRPNVGKSTLFNRLTKTKSAIVTDVPGTTRDRKVGKASIAGINVTLVDTGGLDERDKLTEDIQRQVEMAVVDADVVLFMLDARAGITPMDKHYASWIRRYIGKQDIDPDILLVANKTEGANLSDVVLESVSESMRLGLGEPVLLSASHGDGMADLSSALVLVEQSRLRRGLLLSSPMEGAGAVEDSQDRPIQFALMGRQNVGKSTLVNAMLGEDRVITGPTPGLTRDSVYIDWDFRDRRFSLVDTAGLKKLRRERHMLGKDMKPVNNRGRMGSAMNTSENKAIDEFHKDDPSIFSLEIEESSLFSALRALRFSQVVVLVVEATQGRFNKTDIAFGQRCLQEGRAMVIAANKSDLSEKSMRQYEMSVQEQAEHYFGDFGDIPVVVTSGLEQKGIVRLLRTVMTTHDAWNMRADTWVLNQWLREVVDIDPPPRVGGKVTRIKYMTQIKGRPPTFVLVCNQSELPPSYMRFMTNKLRNDFRLNGVPLRMIVRKSKANTGASDRADMFKKRRREKARFSRGGRFK